MCAVYLKIAKKADYDKYHMNSIDDDSGAQIRLEFCLVIHFLYFVNMQHKQI